MNLTYRFSWLTCGGGSELPPDTTLRCAPPGQGGRSISAGQLGLLMADNKNWQRLKDLIDYAEERELRRALANYKKPKKGQKRRDT